MSRGNFIPSDIIEAVLLRLPPKALGRFKSVSKTWNSIISEPRFIKDHLQRNIIDHRQTDNKLLAVSTTSGGRFLYLMIELSLPYRDYNDTILATTKEIPPMQWDNILGSCNGLVLARGVNKSMLLMNPTTHDLWKLPANPFEPTYPLIDACQFIYYGFGYDSSSDDYKVVSIQFSRKYDHSDSIYSLRSNSWRKLPNAPRAEPFHCAGYALVNDKCHWFAFSSRLIIAFSLVDELFTEIKLPHSFQNNNLCYCHLLKVGGRLGVYASIRGQVDYELWVMQEYGDAKSWIRVFSHKYYMKPMCFLEGKVRDFVFNSVDGVGVFNMDERRCKNVRIIGCSSRFTIQGSFVESIESTKRIIKTP